MSFEKMDPKKHKTSECLEHWAQGMRKLRPEAFDIGNWSTGRLPESLEELCLTPAQRSACGTTVCLWGATPLLFEGIDFDGPIPVERERWPLVTPQVSAVDLFGIELREAIDLFSGLGSVTAFRRAYQESRPITHEDAAQALEELAAKYRAMGR